MRFPLKVRLMNSQPNDVHHLKANPRVNDPSFNRNGKKNNFYFTYTKQSQQKY